METGAWRYRVTNVTRGAILADRAREATRFLQRLVGLMGHPALAAGEGLHLLPCNGIHTFFMRAPIDALFLNPAAVVLHRFPALPPWRVTGVYAGVRSVLELPPGILEATGTQTGDKLSFERVGLV